MTDMQGALTGAGLGEEPKRPFDRNRINEMPALPFQSDEEFAAALEKQKRDIEDRAHFAEIAYENFTKAIPTLQEFGKATDEKVKERVEELRNWLHEFIYQESDPEYRAIACAIYGLVLLEYVLEKKKETITLRSAKAIFEERLVGLLFLQDAKGSIKKYGKRYSLPPEIAELPEANEALSVLQTLLDQAAYNDRKSARKNITEWDKALGPGGGLLMQDVINGKVGRCRAVCKTDRTEKGQLRLGGVIYWDTDGVNMEVKAAFRGVGRYIDDHGLKILLPVSVVTAPKFDIKVRSREAFLQAKRVWTLWQRCMATDQTAASEEQTEEVPPEAKAPETESSPAAAVKKVSTEVVDEKGLFPCKVPGCNAPPFKSAQARAGHMASHSKAKK